MHTLTMKQDTVELVWRGALVIAAVAIFAMIPLEALATDKGKDSSIAFALCNIISFLTGSIGKSLATIALIIIGVGALMGKISWGVALIVALGIALVFGAGTVVDSLGAQEVGNSGECTVGDYELKGIKGP